MAEIVHPELFVASTAVLVIALVYLGYVIGKR